MTVGDDANWLLELSELPAILGTKPVRSALVQLDLDYTAVRSMERWEEFYARRLVEAARGALTSKVTAATAAVAHTIVRGDGDAAGRHSLGVRLA